MRCKINNKKINKDLCRVYLAGAGMYVCMKKFRLSYYTVETILKKNRIKKRNKTQQRLMMYRNKKGKRYGKWTVIDNGPFKRKGKSYARCRCDCGTVKLVPYNCLFSKTSRSCNCNRRKMLQGEGGVKQLFSNYSKSAKRRHFLFTLKFKYFWKLTRQNCFYCGRPPNQYSDGGSQWSLYKYNGIDRMNPRKGYIKSNCVPCCKYCNVAKSTLTRHHFIKWLKRTYGHYLKTKFLR